MSRYRQSMREAMQEVVSENETFDEAMKWEVKITGLPTFYSDGKSRGQVRQALRKMLKRPDDIESIERTTPAALKKIRRDQAKGEGEDVKQEEVEDAFDYKAKKGAIAAPGSGSIAKAKKAKASDFSKSIEQQMKDALKERFNADDIIRMIQFGHPFKVVDEDIPPELPGEEVPRYKNVSNAVVNKADKKSNRVMAKAEKDTLVPTQTKEQRNTWLEDSDWAKQKRIDKQVSDKLLKIHQEREARYQRQKAQAKDKRDQNKAPVGQQHEIAPVVAAAGRLAVGAVVKKATSKSEKEEDTDWARSKEDERQDSERLATQQAARERRALSKAVANSPIQQALAKRQAAKKKDDLGEIAPPGWGHTKAEKSKTDPSKPKSKIGGSIEAMKKAQERGEIPKDMNIFALAWSMKNKGDNPHYKPGVKDVKKAKYKNEDFDLPPPTVADKDLGDKINREHEKEKKRRARIDAKKTAAGKKLPYKKIEDSKLPPHLSKFFDKKGDMKPDVAKRVAAGRKKREAAAKVTDVTPKGYGPNEEENLLDSAKRYLNEKADWNTAFKSAAQSRPPMKYKDAVSFIDTAGLNSIEKRSALKAAKKWLR